MFSNTQFMLSPFYSLGAEWTHLVIAGLLADTLNFNLLIRR